MPTNLEWYGPQATKWIRTEIVRRLRRCGILVANHAKKLLSVDGTSKGEKGRDGKGRFRKLKYNANPSAPGDPHHLQTGRLRGSVTSEVDEASLTCRVGTNVDYGRLLELGTRWIKARPWLRRALAEKQGEVTSNLSAPMKGP